MDALPVRHTMVTRPPRQGQAGEPTQMTLSLGAANPANPLPVPRLKAVGWQFLPTPKPVAESWSLRCQALQVCLCVRACVCVLTLGWGGPGLGGREGGLPLTPMPVQST